MIKINLLREPVRPKASFAKSDARFKVVAVAVLAVMALALGFWYWSLSGELAEKQTRVRELEQESVRLQALRAELKRFQDRKAELDRRLAVVEQLQNNKQGPVNLMNSLIVSVPDEPRLWLTSLSQRGTNVTIEGNALDVPAIAGFIAELGRRSPFNNVELDFWEQEAASLKFKLTCEVGGK